MQTRNDLSLALAELMNTPLRFFRWITICNHAQNGKHNHHKRSIKEAYSPYELHCWRFSLVVRRDIADLRIFDGVVVVVRVEQAIIGV